MTPAFYYRWRFCCKMPFFLKWAMLDLNQRPPPCKGGALPLS